MTDAEAAFQPLLEAIPLPAWVHDVETRKVLAANAAFVALTGRTPEDLIGAPMLDLCAPSDRSKVALLLDRLLLAPAGNLQHAQPFSLITAGGRAVRARISSNPVPSIRPHARLAVAHDIQSEEDERARTDERWRMFVEMCPLPAAITRVDPDGRRGVEFLVINDALAEMSGFSRDELLAKTPLDLIHPEDRRELFFDSKRASTAPGPVRFDERTWRHIRKDGTYLDVHLGSLALTFEEKEARVTVLSDVTTIRQAEALLTQSEQRDQVLFDACPIAACVYDLTTLQMRAVNDAMVRQYGYSREELLRMSVLDIVAPEDADYIRGIISDLRLGKRPGILRHTDTVRHRRKDGSTLDIEGIAAPLMYEGRIARIVLHKDVTKQKLAEDELMKRARIDAFRADLGVAMTSDEPLPAHFERVVQAVEHHLDLESIGIWVIDEATNQLHLQASAGTLDTATAGGRRLDFGETWIGRAAERATSVMLDTSDPMMRPMEVTQALSFGVTHVAAFPLVVRRRVLGVITASRRGAVPEELVQLLSATAVQIAQSLGTAFAYEALRLSESLSRSILDNMLSALITLNEDGQIETANPAAGKTFGYAIDELTGKPLAHLFDMSSLDPKRLLTTARGRVTEWKGRRRSGELFPCELRLFHLESLRGSGYAAILHDVSERYEIERMKAEFVSVVSHELRTPLTALRGSIGLLAGGVLGDLPEEVMELLHIAERNTLRLISLVNDILDLERLQKGKMELFIGPVRARTLVDRSVESVKAFADQEHVRIEVKCVDEVVRGDGDRLVQVLVNLLSNAVKFSPGGSVVLVSTAVEPEAVVFRVTDHGRGIPVLYRRVIFERFQQVHTSDARDKGGTGLGLAISKAIVEQHSGTIGVESEEGVGSTFWFRVPRAS